MKATEALDMLKRGDVKQAIDAAKKLGISHVSISQLKVTPVLRRACPHHTFVDLSVRHM